MGHGRLKPYKKQSKPTHTSDFQGFGVSQIRTSPLAPFFITGKALRSVASRGSSFNSPQSHVPRCPIFFTTIPFFRASTGVYLFMTLNKIRWLIYRLVKGLGVFALKWRSHLGQTEGIWDKSHAIWDKRGSKWDISFIYGTHKSFYIKVLRGVLSFCPN